MARASKSVVPPGAKGTMIRTGLLGQVCEIATFPVATNAISTGTEMKNLLKIMV
jgi:hypothetical protein